MKKIKNILILSVVLIALLLVYLVASPMWSEEGGETTTEAPEQTVTVIDHNKLTGFELTVKGENESNTMSFTLNDGGTAWLWSENAEIPLDNNVFAAVVSALTEATTKYILDDVTSDDIAKFGLDDPAFKLKLTNEDGTIREYSIGDYNAFNARYYFFEASDPETVYMVDAEVTESLDLDIYDFVLAEAPPTITEGKLLGVAFAPGASGPDKKFKYYPAGNEKDYTDKYNWYYGIGEASAAPLNGNIADILTDLVTALSFDECVGFDCTEEKYGFSDSRKITVTYNVDDNGVLSEKTYVIYLGSQTEEGEIYAHTDSSKLVYLISDADDWVKIINGEQKDFITSELWLPNYEHIDHMTFTVGDKSITFNVKNTDGKISYTSDAEFDAEKLEELLEALEELKATSHTSVLEGNDPPEKKTYFTLNVKFNSGDENEGNMSAATYTEKYCQVGFMGNTERLITTEDAEKIASLISALFADGTGAE